MARFKNFAISTMQDLSLPIGSTSITVATSDGALFPDEVPFEIVIFNKTDNPEVTGDVDKESVLVTAVSGDTFTIEPTVNAHSTGGKEYGVIAPWTARCAERGYGQMVELPYDSANFTTSDYEGGPATWSVPDNGQNKIYYGRCGNIGFVSVRLLNTSNTLSGGFNEDELRITLPDSMMPATGTTFTVGGTLHWRHLSFGGADGGWQMGVITMQDTGGGGVGPACVTLTSDLAFAGTWDGTTSGSGYIMWGSIVYPLMP